MSEASAITLLKNDDVRKLVVARLSTLSSDTILSIGAEGSFSRDELINHVQRGDEIGKKIEAVELEWMRSWKEQSAV